MRQSKSTAPVEDFDGLSVAQMHYMVYEPYGASCPVQFKKNMSDEMLDAIPVFCNVKDLLCIINDAEGLKQTAAGYIPPKVVREWYEKKNLSSFWIEKGYAKTRTENDWIVIATINLVLELAGIIRVYKKKLVLIKKWQKAVEQQEFSELFHVFLEAFTNCFNWAYNDRYSNEFSGQSGFMYLLYLLHRYGEQTRNLNFYTDLYYKAFPNLHFAGMYDYDEGYKVCENAVYLRFFERFAVWFGLVEIEDDRRTRYRKSEAEITATDTFRSLLSRL